MKELSIFVDESGDFGEYAQHSPYYIVSMILHDQENDISANIARLDCRFRFNSTPIPIERYAIPLLSVKQS